MSLRVEVIFLLCLLPIALASTREKKLPKFEQKLPKFEQKLPKFEQNGQREFEEREIPTMNAVSRD